MIIPDKIYFSEEDEIIMELCGKKVDPAFVDIATLNLIHYQMNAALNLRREAEWKAGIKYLQELHD